MSPPDEVVEGRNLGFATVSAARLEVGELPEALRRNLPAYPPSVLRLARLAVAEEAKGQGVGRVPLRAVSALAFRMADAFGCVGVVGDARSEAVGSYKRLGFGVRERARGALGDRPQPAPMFLGLGPIPRLIHPSSAGAR